MKEIPKRIMINAKDVMLICGVSRPTAWRLLKKVREHNNKCRYSPVSTHEFCAFYKLRPEDICDFLV